MAEVDCYLVMYAFLSVRLSARMEWLDFHWTDFLKIWYLNIFENLSREFKFYWSLTYIKTYVHLWYLAEFFLELKVFQTEVVQKIKSHILYSVFFSIFGQNTGIQKKSAAAYQLNVS